MTTTEHSPIAAPVVVIANPVSHQASPALRGQVAAALARRGLLGDVVLTRHAGHARTLAEQAAGAGAGTVVAMGGDGTLSQVAAGLAGSRAALLPFPTGCTNVLARGLGWPARPQPALASLDRALAGAGIRHSLRLWAIHVDGTPYPLCINAGVGIDGETVEWIEARQGLKRRFGQLGFVVAATRAVRRIDRAPVLRVTTDGASQDLFSLLMAIGWPYAFLGPRPLDLMPAARFDGRLHWIGLTRPSPLAVGLAAGRALAGLPLAGHCGIVEGACSREVTIAAPKPVAVHVDGEPVGRHEEIRLRPAGEVTVIAARPPRGAPAG